MPCFFFSSFPRDRQNDFANAWHFLVARNIRRYPPPRPPFFFLCVAAAIQLIRPSRPRIGGVDLERLVVIQSEFLSELPDGFVERFLVSVSISEDNGGRGKGCWRGYNNTAIRGGEIISGNSNSMVSR